MNQSFCTKCGSKLDEDSVFCTECGCRTEEVTGQMQGRQDSVVIQKANSKGKGIIFKITLGLLVLAVVVFGGLKLQDFFKPSAGSGSMTDEQTNTDMETAPDPTVEASTAKASDVENTTEATDKVENDKSTEVKTDAPIDFSKLVIKQDGFSINSDNASVFNSLKQTPADMADLSGTWTGKAYILGLVLEYDKTKASDKYISSIPKPEDAIIRDTINSSCDLSIDFKNPELSDKVVLNLTYDKDTKIGEHLTYIDIFNITSPWDFNKGVLTFKKSTDYNEVTSYGIIGKDKDNKQVMAILMTVVNEIIINYDTDAKGKSMMQTEIYLTKK